MYYSQSHREHRVALAIGLFIMFIGFALGGAASIAISNLPENEAHGVPKAVEYDQNLTLKNPQKPIEFSLQPQERAALKIVHGRTTAARVVKG